MGGKLKKVAIMQPYLFPHIGYFHLIDAIDTFVFFDDVAFIKKGWINRNKILLNDDCHNWSLPLIDISQNRLINDHEIFESEKSKKKLLAMLRNAYKKAPYFSDVIPLIEKVLNGPENNISRLAEKSILNVCHYLQMEKEFLISSNVEKDTGLPAQERIIHMVKTLGGAAYYNTIGGRELYDKKVFAQNGIELNFIDSDQIIYPQFSEKFTPYLSVLDVLMFNDRKTCQKFIKQYKSV